MITLLVAALMAASVHLFTYGLTFPSYGNLRFTFGFRIHHPFLLSDNRHYTFYVWRRIFMLHPLVPYLFIPGYIACAWAWFLRAGKFTFSDSQVISR